MQKRKSGHLFWLAAGAIAVLTLLPGRLGPDDIGFTRCLACGDLSALDAVHNLLLFVPLGWLAVRRFDRPGVVVLACALVSTAIEFGQVSLIPDRDASVVDILTNTLGAAVGVALPWLVRGPGRFWIAGSVLFIATLASGAILMKPGDLPDLQIYGQWAPRRPNFDRFMGQVTRVSLDSVAVPHGLLPDQQGFRDAWDRRASVRVQFEDTSGQGNRPQLVARIVAVNEEVFLVARQSDAVIARLRLRATSVGLRPLLIRLDLPERRAGPIETSAGFAFNAIVVEGGQVGDRPMVRRVPLGASLAWALLLPFELPLGLWASYVSLAWIAMLTAPVGWAAARQCRGVPGVMGVAMTVGPLVLGLAVVPIVVRSAPTEWMSWAGGFCGLLAGWWLSVTAGRVRGESRIERVQPSL